MSNTTLGFEETTFADWIYTEDWCSFCDKIYIRLEYDDKTRTTKCPKCGHIETYTEEDWKILQAERYVCYQYMPGKYYFPELLTAEDIFRKYIRELNHEDWCSWLIHDYVLGRMRNNKTIQDKLREAAKITIEKMDYDPKPWNKLFEKMDAHDTKIFEQVPQILYEMVEKKFQEVVSKRELQELLDCYSDTIASAYSYSRWKGDRVACWVTREVNRLCEDEIKEKDEKLFDDYDYDPFLDDFITDVLTGRKREFDLQETYIQWQLELADKFLESSNALVAVWDAYFALVTKLGIHAIWPLNKVADFDADTVERVAETIGDHSLFTFYDKATELNSVDKRKACYYAKNFIEKVKEILPNLVHPSQKLKKALTYVS